MFPPLAKQKPVCCAAVARLVKDVFESAAGIDAVGAVSDYLRSQRVTSLPDLQVTEPSVTDPSGTEPSVAEPSVTEPSVTEPSVTETLHD